MSLERVYKSFGARYPDLLVALFFGWVVFLTALHVAQLGPYFDAELGQLARILAVGAASMMVGALLWAPMLRRSLAPVRTFSERSDAETASPAWEAIVNGFPRAFARTVIVICLFSIPPLAFAMEHLDFAAYWVAIVFPILVTLIGAGTLLGYLAWEAALGPVTRAIHASLPERSTEAPRWVSLGSKLLAVPSASTLYAAALTGALVQDGFTTAERLLAGIGSAVVVTGTISLAMTLLLRRSFLDPTRELVAATERVGNRDFATPVPLTSADELGTLTVSFNRMMEGLRERAAMQEALEAYVHPDIVGRLVSDGKVLKGHELEATIVVLDVRDFTRFAESVSPREAVELLNTLFSVAVPILEQAGGHANKFLGDGLLGAFGAPRPLADHAERAVGAACEVHDAVTREFRGLIRIGIGINSGKVLVGTVGGGSHLEYTLIGDTVNVAARVEKLTKETGCPVLLTEQTRTLLADPPPRLEARGEIPVKGKKRPVEVFAVPANEPSDRTDSPLGLREANEG